MQYYMCNVAKIFVLTVQEPKGLGRGGSRGGERGMEVISLEMLFPTTA